MKTQEKLQEESRISESFFNIDKIKIDKELFGHIFYTKGNAEFQNKTIFEGKEQITTFFETTYNRLKSFIGYIIPQFEEIDKDDITLRSLSIKYDGLGNPLGIVISASIIFREDIKAPLNFSTPYCKFENNDFELGRDSLKIIQELISLAKKYIEGETRSKQLKLVE